MNRLIFWCFALLMGQNAIAQKRAVEISDFAQWNTIRNVQLSSNGKLLGYEITPNRGDVSLVIRNLSSETERNIARGEGVKFNGSSQLAAFRIKPSLVQQREAKVKKLSKSKIPTDSIGIYVVADDSVHRFEKLKEFRVPSEGGPWVAFTTDAKAPTIQKQRADSASADSVQVKKATAKTPKGGNSLIVFNGITCDTILIPNVEEFVWSDNGKVLVYLRKVEDSTTIYSIHVFNTFTSVSRIIKSGKTLVKKLSTDKSGNFAAWYATSDTGKIKRYSLELSSTTKPSVIIVADTLTAALPKGWGPSDNSSIDFSDDGSRLFFGTAPKPLNEPEDTFLLGEKVSVDIWSHNDLLLQSQQKAGLLREKNRTYKAIYHIDKKKVVQLADTLYESVWIARKGNGKYAVATSPKQYQWASNWTGRFLNDYYLTDMNSGKRSELVKGVNRTSMSPLQNFFAYFRWQDSSYYVVNISSGKRSKIASDIPFSLNNTEIDIPSDPPAYGIAGWGEKDRYLFLYDKYDVWRVDPNGKQPSVNITNGREKRLISRVIDTDADNDFFMSDKIQLLSVFDEVSKKAGFARVSLNSGNKPTLMLLEPKSFSYPVKALNAGVLAYTRQDFNEFPDVWISDMSFTKRVKVSDANPQKDGFLWGDVSLVKWKSFNGEQLDGLLYKPESFDSTAKYPVVVYFYERNSDELYSFNSISPSRSVINKSFYVSNGYVVFVPDIKYRTGYPGQSAYECIVSGTQALIERYNWIDEKHIGLQGQSWGGYQTAYLITQTNMFAAAMAGAPVSNMTSAYGGIRWESGMSRMFQYEHTQSRIGGTLWEKPMLYIENSPLFYANKVNTPLLIMHNDNDGAVPWYQGIEYYMALRRLDKKVWMLNYNNEPHNLNAASWGNRVDLSTRMKQFFDHYLKGAPAPEWMTKGVKAVDKGYRKGY
jgi:dipeptidyl aminopeptidase/acylaminoacyl peptidase